MGDQDETPPARPPIKRRAQTATERDLEGILARKERERSLPHGVPVLTHESDPEDFTPVGDTLARVNDPEVQLAIAAIWRHTANIEMRLRARHEESDAAKTSARVNDLELALVDVRGESGTNGKLGNLRAELAEAKANHTTLVNRFWKLVMLVLGGVGGAAAKLILISRAYGSLETQVEANRLELQQQQTEIQALQSLAFQRFGRHLMPEKDPTP